MLIWEMWILQCMQNSFQAYPIIISIAIGVLKNMTRNEEINEKLGKTKIFETVQDLMFTHRADASVVESCCSLFRNLTRSRGLHCLANNFYHATKVVYSFQTIELSYGILEYVRVLLMQWWNFPQMLVLLSMDVSQSTTYADSKQGSQLQSSFSLSMLFSLSHSFPYFFPFYFLLTLSSSFFLLSSFFFLLSSFFSFSLILSFFVTLFLNFLASIRWLKISFLYLSFSIFSIA